MMLHRGKTCRDVTSGKNMQGCYIGGKQQCCDIGENHSSVVTSGKPRGGYIRGDHSEVTSDKNTAISKPADMSHIRQNHEEMLRKTRNCNTLNIVKI